MFFPLLWYGIFKDRFQLWRLPKDQNKIYDKSGFTHPKIWGTIKHINC